MGKQYSMNDDAARDDAMRYLRQGYRVGFAGSSAGWSFWIVTPDRYYIVPREYGVEKIRPEDWTLTDGWIDPVYCGAAYHTDHKILKASDHMPLVRRIFKYIPGASDDKC